MITAGHHSHRKAAGIEIGVQAGTPLFDSDPDDVDVLAPVTEYVAPAPAVVCDEPATVIEYMSSAPVIGYHCGEKIAKLKLIQNELILLIGRRK